MFNQCKVITVKASISFSVIYGLKYCVWYNSCVFFIVREVTGDAGDIVTSSEIFTDLGKILSQIQNSQCFPLECKRDVFEKQQNIRKYNGSRGKLEKEKTVQSGSIG